MILKLCGTKADWVKDDFEYAFVDCQTSQAIATATFLSSDWCKLFYQGMCYVFNTYPKIIKKSELNTPYPSSSKMKRTMGFRILQDEKQISHDYGGALNCGAPGKAKRNMAITVFELFGNTYTLYHVGFPEEPGHWYCLFDNHGNTVGIIERYTVRKDRSKATLHIVDPANLLVMLLVATEKFVLVATGQGMDRTSAKYVSRYEEEKQFFDREFVNRTITQN